MSHWRIESGWRRSLWQQLICLWSQSAEKVPEKWITSDWITKLPEKGYLWHLLLQDHNGGIAVRPHELYKNTWDISVNCGDYDYKLIKKRSLHIPLGVSNWKLGIFGMTPHVPKIGPLPLVDLSLSLVTLTEHTHVWWRSHNSAPPPFACDSLSHVTDTDFVRYQIWTSDWWHHTRNSNTKYPTHDISRCKLAELVWRGIMTCTHCKSFTAS